jgi:hypothetical protein
MCQKGRVANILRQHIQKYAAPSWNSGKITRRLFEDNAPAFPFEFSNKPCPFGGCKQFAGFSQLQVGRAADKGLVTNYASLIHSNNWLEVG